jgi:lambda repressor-like predicted transcriptional regulator
VKDNSRAKRQAVVEPILVSKGWSLGDFADEAGLDYNTVSDYIAGKRRPYRSTKKKMANALGVDPSELP